MKIVYFGTPRFAAVVLDYLLANNIEISAVVTQPDRPKGRSSKLAYSPAKEIILEKAPELPIFQPEKARDEEFLGGLKKLGADLFVVVAYGQILPQKVLDIPTLGSINVHASLLPKYRGAAPMQRCLMNGDRETGVAIQKMVLKMDAGDVIAVSKTKVSEEMNFGELEERLMELSKHLLLKVIQDYEKRIPPAIPQEHEKATYAAKIELEDGLIDWGRRAHEIHNLIRSISPKPGAWCWVSIGSDRKRLKILKSKISGTKGQPGDLLPSATVACGHGAIELLEVQPEGKKKMNASDWLRGQRNISFTASC